MNGKLLGGLRDGEYRVLAVVPGATMVVVDSLPRESLKAAADVLARDQSQRADAPREGALCEAPGAMAHGGYAPGAHGVPGGGGAAPAQGAAVSAMTTGRIGCAAASRCAGAGNYRVHKVVMRAGTVTRMAGGKASPMVERRRLPEPERQALALMELADRVNLSVDRLTELLATLEAQPTATRELILRRFVEAWLMHQREAYEADHHGGQDD